MRATPPLVLLLALSACVVGPTRQDVLAGLVGQPEAVVVRQLGVPSRTYETGGRKFLAYAERRTDVLPGFYAGGIGFWGPQYGYYGAFAPSVIERVCETTFEVAEGRVVSWSLRGNACT